MAKQFQKAEKASAKLRLALIGPPGSGKTFSALAVAGGLGAKIALIDTEHGSASKYADLFPFDTLQLDNFHPNQYVEAIQAAEKAGYDVVIIDSLSHAWIGKGGGLDLHDQAVARQKVKNSFTAWAEVTPHHTALINALVQSKCHVIATMRSKVEYVQEKDDRTGRTNIRKVGMAPLMRDGVEYEFDLVGDLDVDNKFCVTKSRIPYLSGKVIDKPGLDLGKQLSVWLQGAEPKLNLMPAPPPKPAKNEPAGDAAEPELADAPTCAAIGDLCRSLNLTKASAREILCGVIGRAVPIKENLILTADEAEMILEHLRALKEEPEGMGAWAKGDRPEGR